MVVMVVVVVIMVPGYMILSRTTVKTGVIPRIQGRGQSGRRTPRGQRRNQVAVTLELEPIDLTWLYERQRCWKREPFEHAVYVRSIFWMI